MFADSFGIPVGETHAGRGACATARPAAVAGGHRRSTARPAPPSSPAEPTSCSCVGTRLHDFVTGSSSAFHDPHVRFVCINVNGRDAYKLGALPITADAKLALEALTEAGRAAGVAPTTSGWPRRSS